MDVYKLIKNWQSLSKAIIVLPVMFGNQFEHKSYSLVISTKNFLICLMGKKFKF
jgi:hypothetical protein